MVAIIEPKKERPRRTKQWVRGMEELPPGVLKSSLMDIQLYALLAIICGKSVAQMGPFAIARIITP